MPVEVLFLVFIVVWYHLFRLCFLFFRILRVLRGVPPHFSFFGVWVGTVGGTTGERRVFVRTAPTSARVAASVSTADAT